MKAQEVQHSPDQGTVLQYLHEVTLEAHVKHEPVVEHLETPLDQRRGDHGSHEQREEEGYRNLSCSHRTGEMVQGGGAE